MVFEIMKKIAEKEEFDKMVIVSGDGDYIKLVKYLIEKDLLKKIIFPNTKHSSLYKKIGNKFYYYLSEVKSKIEYVKNLH